MRTWSPALIFATVTTIFLWSQDPQSRNTCWCSKLTQRSCWFPWLFSPPPPNSRALKPCNITSIPSTPVIIVYFSKSYAHPLMTQCGRFILMFFPAYSLYLRCDSTLNNIPFPANFIILFWFGWIGTLKLQLDHFVEEDESLNCCYYWDNYFFRTRINFRFKITTSLAIF